MGLKNITSTNLKSEFNLLIDLCTQQLANNYCIASTNEIDWKKFIVLIKQHRLACITPVQIERNGFKMNETSSSILHNHNQNIKLKMLSLAAEIARVSKKLKEQSIDSIQLKGPVAAIQIYNDLGAKNSRDIDVLIDEQNLEMTLLILRNEGYELIYPYEKLNYAQKKYFNKVNNQLALTHPNKKIRVEVHWRLFANRHLLPYNFEDLYQNKQTVKLGNTTVNGLGAKHLLIYLCVHGAKHAWSKLYWLLEIAILLKKEKDIHFILAEAQLYGVERPVYQAAFLSKLLFNLKLDKVVLAKEDSILNEMISYALTEFQHTKEKTTPTFLENRKYRGSLKKDKLYKLAEFKWISINDFTSVSLPSSLFFLYYPLRPFIWGWRYLNNSRS